MNTGAAQDKVLLTITGQIIEMIVTVRDVA
jgi:hypothetical protein